MKLSQSEIVDFLKREKPNFMLCCAVTAGGLIIFHSIFTWLV